jgi:hypothetical protein
MFKGLAAALAALLIAIVVVRNAAVDAFADTKPRAAAKVWAGHPEVELQNGLVDIAEAMRARRQVDPKVFALIADAARKAPLDAQPYLVRGVQAQIGGNSKEAEQAFLSAQMRDPRSLPAAYFLADHYLRNGDAAHATEQVALVARLAPSGPQTVAPYVAALARDRANWPFLRNLLKGDAQLHVLSLSEMAKDPANADAVVAIAGFNSNSAPPTWLPTLLDGLVKDGQYPKAREIWAKLSNAHDAAGTLLYDPTFSAPSPPPPFNWQMTSSTVGLAERQKGEAAHILYYGQEDGPLLSQLLVLPPGRYRLLVKILPGSSHPDALDWHINCAKSDRELARAKLSDVAAASGLTFTVPADCPAQNLSLSGSSSDMPQQSDVTITGLKLLLGGQGV